MSRYLVTVTIAVEDAEASVDAALEASRVFSLLDTGNVKASKIVEVQRLDSKFSSFIDITDFDRCTCREAVAAGLEDGPLCPYCKWVNRTKEIPY